MANREDYLFNKKGDWFGLQQSLTLSLGKEIQAYPADRLLATPIDQIVEYFVEKFTLDLPAIDEDGITADQKEVQIDASRSSHGDYGFMDYDRGASRTVPGTEYEFHIPFSGNADLFHFQPTTFTSGLPKAKVQDNHLVYFVSGRSLQPEQVKANVKKTIADIQQYLGWLGQSTNEWNRRLPGQVEPLVRQRYQKLMDDRNSVADLGFKLRERPGATRTFAAPEVRRKVIPIMPPTSSLPWKPEPALEMNLYEHILKVLSDSARTMELSPSAFRTLGEEDLRTHLLVQLNGHFEGGATGETFNYEGKTDILIRSNGKNIFIGECKFWGGAKVLTETIDQLLGYTSWRDTKVAVIIFNRNRDFSNVLRQVCPIVEAHPNYKRFEKQISETQFRFTFAQRDDSNREMTLTVLMFDVPQP